MVTDPPGGLEMGARVGRSWDCFRRARNPNDAGRDNAFGRMSRSAPHSYGESDRGAFVAFMTEAMQASWRALTPGANCLVWAFPRTSHWTAFALEDAGFEIRDVITHLQAQGMPKSRALLKPGSEHWILCRKPGPLRHLNLDPCRVPREVLLSNHARSHDAALATAARGNYGFDGAQEEHTTPGQELGGWPANVLLSHGEHCRQRVVGPPEIWACEHGCPVDALGDDARFFVKFQAKPGTREKRRGLGADDVVHPTVKSIELMKWLVTLVSNPGDWLLDPFAGSGTTLIAAALLGRNSVGVEREEEYATITEKRIEWHLRESAQTA